MFEDTFDDYDDEVDALWNGQLPMDRVLQILQNEIESRKAAEKRVQELEAQLAAQVWRPLADEPKKSGWYAVRNDEDDGLAIMYWTAPEREVYDYGEYIDIDGCWAANPGDDDIEIYLEEGETLWFTHWCPLPPFTTATE